MLESVSLILELGINQDRFSVFHFFQCVSVFIHLKNLAQPFAMKATQDAGLATTADEAGGTGNAGNDGQEKRDCTVGSNMKRESREVNRRLWIVTQVLIIMVYIYIY